jgi:hypothetical protein
MSKTSLAISDDRNETGWETFLRVCHPVPVKVCYFFFFPPVVLVFFLAAMLLTPDQFVWFSVLV